VRQASLARAGVALVLTTDSLPVQGEAQLHLAEVLEAAGKRTEAALALDEPLKTFEAKRIVPLAQRARERLAALQEGQRSAGGLTPSEASCQRGAWPCFNQTARCRRPRFSGKPKIHTVGPWVENGA
jgi:hypothetical protein